jgi:DNA-binding PadR family transcriptional regulator
VLGAFEEMVMLAVVHCGDAAYGVTVRRELERRTGSGVSMGAVTATLDRLDAKGLLESSIGERTESRRGRPRRYFRLAAAGSLELARTREVRERMWAGAELPEGGSA